MPIRMFRILPLPQVERPLVAGRLQHADPRRAKCIGCSRDAIKSGGFDAVHVPFNGSPPAVTATIQNETQMIFAVMQPLQPQIEDRLGAGGVLAGVGVAVGEVIAKVGDIHHGGQTDLAHVGEALDLAGFLPSLCEDRKENGSKNRNNRDDDK